MGNIGIEDGFVILERVEPGEGQREDELHQEQAAAPELADEIMTLTPAEVAQLEAALDEQPA